MRVNDSYQIESNSIPITGLSFANFQSRWSSIQFCIATDSYTNSWPSTCHQRRGYHRWDHLLFQSEHILSHVWDQSKHWIGEKVLNFWINAHFTYVYPFYTCFTHVFQWRLIVYTFLRVHFVDETIVFKTKFRKMIKFSEYMRTNWLSNQTSRIDPRIYS